ncbi:type II secretion system F family protein [Actinomadura kijaniata]|uniref:Tight adherence protein B n=1 Tax=Actinomadura namibiensis TaxID=182080 RepID=A0A7W3LI78_ACTNM|nr:type II secretion system F family protein [Actinomadura namibiensis]MBA8948549.1 tight adherence protein B [Actinomadura namibiensis]
MSYPIVLLSLFVTLVIAILGIWQFGMGLDQQREQAARGSRGFNERKMATRLDRWDARLRRTTIGRQINRRIAASGLRVRLSIFVLTMTGAAVAIALLLSQVLSLFLGIVTAVGVGLAFFGFLRQQESRRVEEFIGQLPELARVLSNAAAAGLSIRTALEMAAEELDDPARTELTRTAEALRLGQAFDDAMTELRDRLPSRELGVLVSTLAVASRSGGSLITSLRNISDTLEQRKETRREVKTIVGESVAAGWAIFTMGMATLFGIAFLSPGAVDRMTGSLIGQLVLLISMSLFAGALLIIRRMTRIDL